MSTKWSGGDAWSLEVEVDCFSSAEPFVAAVWTECGEDCALAPLSAEEARELAAALLVVADAVDENNARTFTQAGALGGANPTRREA